MRVFVVAQFDRQDVLRNSSAQFRIFDWKHGFNAPEKIPRHPIGAAAIDERLSCVLEIEDARVLEETPEDISDADVLTDAFQAGQQTAGRANDQVDLHSGL